jgi:hypothetical protein
MQEKQIKLMPNQRIYNNIFSSDLNFQYGLSLFSQSILRADQLGSKKWCIYSEKDRIRLVMGGLISCVLINDRIWLPLDKESIPLNSIIDSKISGSNIWEWDLKDKEYQALPSRNGYLLLDHAEDPLLEEILRLHYKYLEKNSNKYEELGKRSQTKHDPILLDDISDKVGTKLPQPDLLNSSSFSLENDVEQISNRKDISETEKLSLINSRIGQNKFRSDLKQFWNNECSVSDCTDVSLLIASHIKPWAVSSHTERLDVFNGLLLLPNLDKAFELGLISFDDEGSILISPSMSDSLRNSLGITKEMKLKDIRPGHRIYLGYHRKNRFNE